MISPFEKKKIAWDTFIGLNYLLSYLLDPYILCFFFTPLENDSIYGMQRGISIIVTIDILFNFVTGIPRDDNTIPLDEDEEE